MIIFSNRLTNDFNNTFSNVAKYGHAIGASTVGKISVPLSKETQKLMQTHSFKTFGQTTEAFKNNHANYIVSIDPQIMGILNHDHGTEVTNAMKSKVVSDLKKQFGNQVIVFEDSGKFVAVINSQSYPEPLTNLKNIFKPEAWNQFSKLAGKSGESIFGVAVSKVPKGNYDYYQVKAQTTQAAGETKGVSLIEAKLALISPSQSEVMKPAKKIKTDLLPPNLWPLVDTALKTSPGEFRTFIGNQGGINPEHKSILIKANEEVFIEYKLLIDNKEIPVYNKKGFNVAYPHLEKIIAIDKGYIGASNIFLTSKNNVDTLAFETRYKLYEESFVELNKKYPGVIPEIFRTGGDELAIGFKGAVHQAGFDEAVKESVLKAEAKLKDMEITLSKDGLKEQFGPEKAEVIWSKIVKENRSFLGSLFGGDTFKCKYGEAFVLYNKVTIELTKIDTPGTAEHAFVEWAQKEGEIKDLEKWKKGEGKAADNLTRQLKFDPKTLSPEGIQKFFELSEKYFELSKSAKGPQMRGAILDKNPLLSSDTFLAEADNLVGQQKGIHENTILTVAETKNLINISEINRNLEQLEKQFKASPKQAEAIYKKAYSLIKEKLIKESDYSFQKFSNFENEVVNWHREKHAYLSHEVLPTKGYAENSSVYIEMESRAMNDVKEKTFLGKHAGNGDRLNFETVKINIRDAQGKVTAQEYKLLTMGDIQGHGITANRDSFQWNEAHQTALSEMKRLGPYASPKVAFEVYQRVHNQIGYRLVNSATNSFMSTTNALIDTKNNKAYVQTEGNEIIAYRDGKASYIEKAGPYAGLFEYSAPSIEVDLKTTKLFLFSDAYAEYSGSHTDSEKLLSWTEEAHAQNKPVKAYIQEQLQKLSNGKLEFRDDASYVEISSHDQKDPKLKSLSDKDIEKSKIYHGKNTAAQLQKFNAQLMLIAQKTGNPLTVLKYFQKYNPEIKLGITAEKIMLTKMIEGLNSQQMALKLAETLTLNDMMQPTRSEYIEHIITIEEKLVSVDSVQLEKGFERLSEIFKKPETYTKINEYLEKNPELKKAVKEKVNSEMKGLLKHQLGGLLLGIVTAIGIEKIAPLVGIDHEKDPYLYTAFVLSGAHTVNYGVQTALAQKPTIQGMVGTIRNSKQLTSTLKTGLNNYRKSFSIKGMATSIGMGMLMSELFETTIGKNMDHNSMTYKASAFMAPFSGDLTRIGFSALALRSDKIKTLMNKTANMTSKTTVNLSKIGSKIIKMAGATLSIALALLDTTALGGSNLKGVKRYLTEHTFGSEEVYMSIDQQNFERLNYTSLLNETLVLLHKKKMITEKDIDQSALPEKTKQQILDAFKTGKAESLVAPDLKPIMPLIQKVLIEYKNNLGTVSPYNTYFTEETLLNDYADWTLGTSTKESAQSNHVLLGQLEMSEAQQCLKNKSLNDPQKILLCSRLQIVSQNQKIDPLKVISFLKLNGLPHENLSVNLSEEQLMQAIENNPKLNNFLLSEEFAKKFISYQSWQSFALNQSKQGKEAALLMEKEIDNDIKISGTKDDKKLLKWVWITQGYTAYMRQLGKAKNMDAKAYFISKLSPAIKEGHLSAFDLDILIPNKQQRINFIRHLENSTKTNKGIMYRPEEKGAILDPYVLSRLLKDTAL